MDAEGSNQGKVAIGPWTVQRKPLAVLEAGDGQTHLSLAGAAGRATDENRWVGLGQLWMKWTGNEETARRLAEEHDAIAVPHEWVTKEEAAAKFGAGVRRLQELQEDIGKRHRHDRTGEEIE